MDFSTTTPSLPPPSQHRQANFVVTTVKRPISKAEPIDELSQRIGIPVPEMIFGDNLVAVTHVPSGWTVEFNAADALDAVGKTGENMLQVAYARDWSRTRGDMVKEVVRPFDWSYSTTYRGTVTVAGQHQQQEQEQEPKGPADQQRRQPVLEKVNAEIPLELLKRRDPILFFDDVVLYESELDDNGISLFSIKVRVHAQRMLLLCRLFMRLDGVIVRIRDTRVYVDFENDTVLREYTAREDKFDNVKRVRFFHRARSTSIYHDHAMLLCFPRPLSIFYLQGPLSDYIV
jgi:type 2A phosphatase activator TIP41